MPHSNDTGRFKRIVQQMQSVKMVTLSEYRGGEARSIDGNRFRQAAQQVAAKNLAIMGQPAAAEILKPYWMAPKGRTNLDALVAASVIGPIGLPAAEAEYPSVTTTDGKPLNAMHDYVIRMTKQQLPPAKAYWSVTLYDMQNGFSIPNDRKKYSVGDNAGMKLDSEGGIAIYIAAEKPMGVPAGNIPVDS